LLVLSFILHRVRLRALRLHHFQALLSLAAVVLSAVVFARSFPVVHAVGSMVFLWAAFLIIV